MRSPVDAAKGHILKSTLVESFIILPRLYGHSIQVCSFFHVDILHTDSN